MNNKFLKKFDPKYLKISLYALGTFFTAVIIIGLAYLSGGFWIKMGAILSAVIKPLVIGLVITYLLLPLTNFFQHKLSRGDELKGTHRAGAVALTMIIVAAAVGAIGVVFFVTLYKQINGLDIKALQEMLDQIKSQYSSLIGNIMDYLQGQGFSSERLGDWLQAFAGQAVGVAKNLLFGVIFAIYFLYDGKRIGAYWRRVTDSLLNPKMIGVSKAFMKDADQAFSGYIRGQFADALCVGVLASITLTVARVPYGPVIGIMTGIGNMIPYFGPIIGYVMIILSGLVSQDIKALVIGLIALAIVQFIDANVINPRLLSNAIQIHPLYVIVCVIAGGAMGGIIGMLVAVPAGALIKKEFERFLAYRNEKKKTDPPRPPAAEPAEPAEDPVTSARFH